MATFKAEVQNKRADGTYNVRIRVTHNREIRRISTNIYVTNDDLTRSLKIKSVNIVEKCDALIKKCREVCNNLGFELFDIPIDDLVAKIKKYLQEFEQFISTEPSQRGNNRKEEKKELEAKGGRAVSKYLACVRAIHNKAKEDTMTKIEAQ